MEELNKELVDAKTLSSIWVTFQKEGFHQYPEAPEGVEFLQNRHRHIFHFRVEMTVGHDNREVEFILLKRELESLYDDGQMELDNQSCEMIARSLVHYLVTKYGRERDYSVTVSEDGENGATVNYYQ